MALVESLPLAIGQVMPAFSLKDPADRLFTLAECMGNKGLLIAFTCNHCPYAIAIWPRLIQFAEQVRPLGVHTIAINPNIHPDYPDDSSTAMLNKIREWGISFPYLVDQDQSVARAYQAQCTPDLYLLSADQTLYYHGRLDDCWKDASQVRVHDLQVAAQHLIQGHAAPSVQYPSMGCSIKWVSDHVG